MTRLIALLFVSILAVSCNSDKTAPSISFIEDNFCTAPGGTIEVTMQIEEENILDEVRITSPDLDFTETIEGSVIEENGGMFTAGFTIHPDTPEGTYELNIQAIDDSENISNGIVTIKVQA